MSTIYYNVHLKHPYRYDEYLDKDDKHFVEIIYTPSVWIANTIYPTGSIILPTTFKGIAYKVTATGKSLATEPVWLNTIGDSITAGPVFEGIDYFDMIDISLALTLTSSTVTASDGVVITLPTMPTQGSVKFLISSIPAIVNSFTVTNHTVWSNLEERDFSILFRVVEK